MQSISVKQNTNEAHAPAKDVLSIMREAEVNLPCDDEGRADVGGRLLLNDARLTGDDDTMSST